MAEAGGMTHGFGLFNQKGAICSCIFFYKGEEFLGSCFF